MKKLQQYYIFKFDSKRLMKDNYDIQLNPWQARKNGELVSIGDSQMLRTLRDITGRQNSINDLQELLERKKNLKHDGSDKNLDLYNIGNKIDEILFVPEIVSVYVSNAKHYTNIIKNGLFINNKKFVRLMCSAGQARRNNVLMVDSDIELELKRILNNDRSDIEITPAKFNAYFALSSSTALPVTTPYFCIVPDCNVVRKEIVDWVTEIDGDDDRIEECEKELTFNLFDGQGIISPRMAKVWSKDLDLDYIPSCFIVRSSFIKGMVCTVDFLKYSDEIGKHIIKDVYGNDVNIRDMDVILTESQFKLWNAYSSTQDYIQKCKKNNIGWGITRVSPKEENDYAFLNYQFIQALNLNQEQIESLCSKTIQYFRSVLSGNMDYTLLYLLGNQANKGYDPDIFNKINDNVTKALILNKDLIGDPYIQNHLRYSLQKRIKESYIGNLLIDGQYTFMVGDPVAFMEYLFDEQIVGALKRDEYYSHYWLDKDVNKIAGMRSPLTWRSEVDILNLVENDKTNEWYEYLNNCVVFNVHGMDMAILGGSDLDGDIICLTNQKEIIDGACGGFPVMYETKKAPKQKIIESELYIADLKGFNTKVGFLTNLSTTMYSMLPLFDKDSKEYKELIRRLKQCRKEQGAIIDATKGLTIKPIPAHWTNWNKITDDISDEKKQKLEFYNSILIEKRPQFMQFLYQDYNKQYRQYCLDYDILAQANFNMFLEDMLNLECPDDDQQNFLNQFYKYNPLLDTPCETNNICKYMQQEIKKIKDECGKTWENKNLDNMKKTDLNEHNKSEEDALYKIYKKYKSEKKNFRNLNEDLGSRFQTIEQYNKCVRQECSKLSSDIGELAHYAIDICYLRETFDNKAFAWDILGSGIIDNLLHNNKNEYFEIPFLDENGDIEYLGKRYSRMKIKIKGSEDFYDFL